MASKKNPMNESARKAAKLRNPGTRGKNAAGQTNGQFEQDKRKRSGQYTQAGEPPLMIK
jgi:hypothetical protein